MGSSRCLPLLRPDTNYDGSRLVELEPGVRIFVLTLEAVGATSVMSCEGHPDGFYIGFKAPYELLLNLVSEQDRRKVLRFMASNMIRSLGLEDQYPLETGDAPVVAKPWPSD